MKKLYLTLSKKFNTYIIGICSEYFVVFILFFYGYSLLHHRYRNKFGEIDLIFKKNKNIIFCEVKIRKEIFDYENIISSKQWKRITNSANFYYMKNKNKFSTYNMRFDAVFITFKKPFFLHIKNITI